MTPAPWRDLFLIMSASALTGLSIGFSTPLSSLVLERAGHGADVIGVNAMFYGLGALSVAFFAPRCLRVLGARASITMGALLAGGAMAAMGLGVDLAFWALCRALLGAGSAMVFVVSETAVNALAPGDRRGRVMAVYGVVFCLGYAAGPLMLALLGSEGAAPFAIGGAVFALSVGPALSAPLLASAVGAQSHDASVAILPRMFAAAPRVFLLIFAFGLAEAGLMAFFPLYAIAKGAEEAMAATLLAACLFGNVLFQPLVGWAADRWPKERVALVALSVACALFALMPMALSSELGRWLLLFALGGALGGLYTLSLAQLGDRFAHGGLAAASVLLVVTFECGVIFGPLWTGGVAAGLGPDAIPLALAAPLLVQLVGQALIRPRRWANS